MSPHFTDIEVGACIHCAVPHHEILWAPDAGQDQHAYVHLERSSQQWTPKPWDGRSKGKQPFFILHFHFFIFLCPLPQSGGLSYEKKEKLRMHRVTDFYIPHMAPIARGRISIFLQNVSPVARENCPEKSLGISYFKNFSINYKLALLPPFLRHWPPVQKIFHAKQ